MNYNNGDLIEYTCSKCKCHTAKILILKNVKIVETAVCTNCGKMVYSKVVGETGLQRPEWTTNAQCPYCKSYNTEKITTASKVRHTALFGIFAISRNSKQWHCNTCKSDF